jgi:hypothetical protein
MFMRSVKMPYRYMLSSCRKASLICRHVAQGRNKKQSRYVDQDIFSPLWTPEFNYPVHKASSLKPILIHLNPFHTYSLRSVLLLSFHLSRGFSSGLLPKDFLTKTKTIASSNACLAVQITKLLKATQKHPLTPEYRGSSTTEKDSPVEDII